MPLLKKEGRFFIIDRLSGVPGRAENYKVAATAASS
jgi:hypothetical protein